MKFRCSFLLSVFCASQVLVSQVTLTADGSSDTYTLITSVLAPNYNPIETPDCNHEAFGDHIDQVFDNALNAYAFRFFIHTSPDNDRCIKFDRQRNEIKSYDKSPNNLLGVENEIVRYQWKFKLADGFQSSSSFTHIHQLKSVGGNFASMPMYTLTTRKSSPDRIELRYAETDSQVTLMQTAIAPFIGAWVDVTETITYASSGTYSITIKKIEDGTDLLSYSNNNINNWRPEAEFVRPKWGIYRSLNSVDDLRDEEVLFADFSVEELETLSTSNLTKDSFQVFVNSALKTIQFENIHNQIQKVQILSLQGRTIIEHHQTSMDHNQIDVSLLASGSYIVNFIGNKVKFSKLVLINN